MAYRTKLSKITGLVKVNPASERRRKFLAMHQKTDKPKNWEEAGDRSRPRPSMPIINLRDPEEL